ncbi:MAG: hypothetical protein NT045_03195 [Candidatus Aureabacteria bacterium]|nr:hypothetical protein [Candidatus Auribacterota bacterium]
MNNSLKGACLSGLVYPGMGQIVQKHYLRGLALIGIVTVNLSVIILTTSKQIETILTNIESSGGEYDVTTILHEATKFSISPYNGIMKISSALILCCWAIGIVDAYLSGKRMDLENKAHNQAMQPTDRAGG